MVRWKRRYLIVYAEYKNKPTKYFKSRSVKESICAAIKSLYGEFGVASILNSLRIHYVNQETQIIYIRVARQNTDMVSAALPLVVAIEDMPVSMHCLFKAATLRHANLFLKNYHNKSIHKGRVKGPLPSFKQKIQMKRYKRV